MAQAISLFCFFLAASGGLVYSTNRWLIASSVRRRAFTDVLESKVETIVDEQPLFSRYRWVPWLVAILGGILVWVVLVWPVVICCTIALMIGLLGAQVESFFYDYRIAKIEQQLADSIDLMVGSLGAGAGAMVAINAAASESTVPLRPVLEELLARIRFGDDPAQVFSDLTHRVPRETFLLFGTTMAVHWEVGGSLAPTLAVLGRTIRDRIEISRRIQSNIVQSQVTTVLVIAITYFITLLMWNHDRDSVRSFASSNVGVWVIAISMGLQAVGIVWMAAMSKMKF